METRYRVIISGKNIYKEIEISSGDKKVKFGTESNCDIRVRKDLFFEPIGLTFSEGEDGKWQMMCSDNVYVYVDGVRKIMTASLEHGTELMVKYQNSENILLFVQFLIDFDYINKEYNRRYDISGIGRVKIGSDANSNIIIGGSYGRNEQIVLDKKGNGLLLSVASTEYGIYHNGTIIREKTVVKNGDFFSIANYSFFYKNGNLYTQSTGQIRENGIKYIDSTKRKGYPKFDRNSRIINLVDDSKIEVLDPPAIPQKPKNNLFTRLLPSLVMVVASIIMGFRGGAFIFFSIASALAGVITAVIGVKEANKDYKKAFEDRINKYNSYIDKKKKDIEKARNDELSVLVEKYISEEEEIEQLKKFSYKLFDRCIEDEDFLDVRLGSGKVEAKRVIDYKKQERLEIEDDLQTKPQKIYEEYKYIDNAPIICNFKNANAIGIIGNQHDRLDIMKNIVVDICARQYHTDVKMFFVVEKNNKDKVYWLRMLPHLQNDILGIHNIVCDDNSKTVIYEYLYKELTSREQAKKNNPHLLVFLYDEYEFESHPISRFVDNASELGVTFIFFGNTRSEIGLGCSYLIECLGNSHGKLFDTKDSKKVYEFQYNTVSDNDVGSMVQLLAPVYTEEISLESSLVKNISLFELLNVIGVEDLDLSERWSSSQVHKSMSAPIGVTKSGIITLDLHDKAHGPHGLVAGTTGSGKSELLQTYIASMTTYYHPYEVGFVIIDFKGGGMANQFRELPHMLGTITNIDGKEIARSLKSIKAELKKRQRYFAEADVNHIDKYILKYKKGEVIEPLPHLILIVDEFAELKAEQPEFMKELISAARIGRSLGVHLILATQKPSGQVDEQIWSNSRFKICLKVQSQQDSNEVIKSPLAAEIKEPGRAYLQIGNNEIFELLQSAYSGAPEHADESGMKEFAIYEISPSGRRKPVFIQKKKKSDNNITQLDAMVSYVKQYCDNNGISSLSNICLPPLSKVIDFPSNDNLTYIENHCVVDLGMYDDPDNQKQSAYSIDLTNQNLMIIGSAQSGKTNLLQTIIRNLATKYSSKEVNIYIIDFASMILKNFEALNHVGGVVTPAEDEKVKNLFKLLFEEIDKRKNTLSSVGVSSFEAYREAGEVDLPQIVVLIDNITMLKELYFEEDDDMLLTLCREGLTVGISIVVANSQTSGIGYKYLANFSSRIALYCNDSSEYSSLFDHCRETLNDIHGRCLVKVDKKHLECQAFYSFKGEKEIDKVNEIRQFVRVVNSKNLDEKAKSIPMIPEQLTEIYIAENYRNYAKDRFSLIVGLDYDTVDPVVIPMNNLGSPLVVSGKKEAGKHNFLKYIVRSLDKLYKDETEVYIIDGIKKKLAPLKNLDNVKFYGFMPDQAGDIVTEIERTLNDRYETFINETEEDLDESKLLVLIINNYDALEMISENQIIFDSYKNIIGRYKNMNVCVLIGDYENMNISYAAPDIVRNLRDDRHFMYFDNISNLKILDIPVSTMRLFKKRIERGDGFYINDNEIVKVKTVKCEIE